jgi:hypothetical protein
VSPSGRWCLMKRHRNNTAKRTPKSTNARAKESGADVVIEPALPVPALEGVGGVGGWQIVTAEQWKRKVHRKRRRAESFGTITTWERDGMGGMNFESAPFRKPTRVPENETIAMLEKCGKLKFADRRKDYWRPALDRWPDVSVGRARAYLRTAIANHRELWDDLEHKYKSST